MTRIEASTQPRPPRGSNDVNWTMRALISRHKRFSIGAVAVLVAMLALLVLAAAGSTGGAVSDSTPCSAWGSASQDQQQAYASLYVKEHGPLAGGATSGARVEAAINKGCTQAFENDVADTINVYQAIHNQY
jgi:hypothetical protein